MPDEVLTRGRIEATAGPVTNAVTDMLANSADSTDVVHRLSPAAVVSADVGEHRIGMVFPADVHKPVMFIDDGGDWRHPSVSSVTFDFTDDPLVLWNVSGQAGDNIESLVVVGGWAAPTVATVALQQDGEWIVADTAEVAGADARGWAVAFSRSSLSPKPFDEVAVYDADGRLLAAAKAAFGVLPSAAVDLRGGGWRSADVGQRAPPTQTSPGCPTVLTSRSHIGR